MSKRFFASLLLLLALISSMGWQRSFAQSGGDQYFTETRHWVKGEFLTKYHSVPNPEELFGYPITPAFFDRTTGLLVQYFLKARFELDNSRPERGVQLSPLGQYLYSEGHPATNLADSGGCQVFENGYKVCYEFLKYFDDNGGEAIFGQPISDMERLNGKIVQHFTNACFEWHPEFAAGQRVRLAFLGYEYFYKIGENPAYLAPEKANFTFNSMLKGITNLRVRAYPLEAVTSMKGKQTIYVVVQDQTLLSVEGAKVTVDVLMPSGEEMRYAIPSLTDEHGVTKFTFSFDSAQVGLVKITVRASQTSLEAKTSTSFRIWW